MWLYRYLKFKISIKFYIEIKLCKDINFCYIIEIPGEQEAPQVEQSLVHFVVKSSLSSSIMKLHSLSENLLLSSKETESSEKLIFRG